MPRLDAAIQQQMNCQPGRAPILRTVAVCDEPEVSRGIALSTAEGITKESHSPPSISMCWASMSVLAVNALVHEDLEAPSTSTSRPRSAGGAGPDLA
jgi:hypothetical protein